LDQLNVLKEKAVMVVAYPKGIERITTLSYSQMKEDRSQSSDNEEDDVSSSVIFPNDSGSSSDEDSSKECESDSESDSDSSCDDLKPKKRSKSKA
jgi:hypothetical protein